MCNLQSVVIPFAAKSTNFSCEDHELAILTNISIKINNNLSNVCVATLCIICCEMPIISALSTQCNYITKYRH